MHFEVVLIECDKGVQINLNGLISEVMFEMTLFLYLLDIHEENNRINEITFNISQYFKA